MDYLDIDLVKDKKSVKTRKRIFQIMATALITVIVVVFVVQRLGIGKVYYYDLGNEITTTIIQEDDEGNISKKEYKDSSIPATGLKDRIIFDVNIPEKLFEENGILCFYQYHSEIRATFEGNEIFQYGKELTEQKKMYGNELCMVEIPPEAWGKTITIEVVQMETDSSNHSTNFRIMKEKDARMYPLVSNTILYVMFIILAIISLLLLIISIVSSILRGEIDLEGLSMSVFTLLLSLWQMGSRRYLYILSNNVRIASNIEFISLYAAAIPLLGYLIKVHKRKKYKQIYTIMMMAYLVFFAVCIFGHTVFHRHIIYFETVFYVVIFVLLALTLVIELFAGRDDRRSKAVDVRNGLLFSGGLCALQVVVIGYREAFHTPIPKIFLSIDFATIAVFVFIMTMFITIGMNFLNTFAVRHEEENNEKLAYMDFLTMIPNRLYCSKVLENYDRQKNSHYGVVFLDLDYLKYGNDKYGHKMGDKMLQTTADCIRECFAGNGSFGRWGGDEFIAIFDNPDEIAEFIERFQGLIRRMNFYKEFPFHFHVSMGTCIKNPDDEMDSNVVVANADAAMYEDKKKYKEEHGL